MAMLCLSISASAYDFEVDGFYYEVNLDNMTATLVAGENKQSGEISIPATVAYKGREFSVTSINGAFSGNDELTKVSLPSSIVSLGSSAFEGCSSLQSISGLDNITELGIACFSGCISLTNIDLPEGLKRIESQVFIGCVGLSTVTIPNSVISIGDEAFQSCTSLSSIKLPPTIASLSKGLLQGCSSLENLDLPNSIITIEDNVLAGCVGLTSLFVPNSIQQIGNGVFDGCIELSHLSIAPASSPLSVGYNKTNNDARTPLFEDCPLSNVIMGRNIESSSRDRNYKRVGCFSSNLSLTEVSIGVNVSAIEQSAFRNCSNLKYILIPRSVVTIGEWAFASSGLEKVTFEDGYDPLNLSLRISSWENKTPKTFSNCKIEEVYLGRTLKVGSGSQSPGNGGSPSTFFPNTLKQIIIGDYVNNVDVLLMYNQKTTSSLSHYPNLMAAQFGVNLPQLPSMAENDLLEKLSTSSTVPPTVNPFANSQYMDLNVEVPEGSLSAYQEAPIWKNFWNLSQNKSLLHCIEVDGILYKIISETSVEVIKKSTEYSGDMVIPSYIEYNEVKYEVASIGEAFKGCAKLTSITIPQSIHTLANNCFKDCSKLENIVFNCIIEEIPYGAFQNCTSLSKIQIPETIKYVRGFAFSGCSKLEEFTCPNSLESIEESVFEKCTSLKSFSLNNVSVIGNSIFEGCNGLVSIDLNSMISVIPKNSFSGCSNLESVSHFNSVVRIESEAFKDCKALKEIFLPNIILILDNAFQNCSSIDAITLGDGLEIIGKGAFSYCSNLESLVIPGNVETFGTSMLSGCSSLKELSFEEGNSPLSFPEGSYDGNTGIQKKEINGKTIQFKIEYYKPFFSGLPIEKLYLARNLSDTPRYTISGDGGVDYYLITSYDAPFSNLSKLTELTIGENVATIGPSEAFIDEVGLAVTPGSFKKCSSLKEIVVKNSTPPAGAEFSNTTYSNATLIVPDNTVSLFQVADGWKEFLNILDETSAGVEPITISNNCPVSVSIYGIIYEGDCDVPILICGIDGKCQYSGNISSGQFIALSKGIYIVTIDGQSMKIKI